MAWKELAGGVVIAALAAGNVAYVSSTAEAAAEKEVRKGLEPVQAQLNRIEDSQTRIEVSHLRHLEHHSQGE